MSKSVKRNLRNIVPTGSSDSIRRGPMTFWRHHAGPRHNLIKLSRQSPDFSALRYRGESLRMQRFAGIAFATIKSAEMRFQRWRERNDLPSPGLAGEEAELIVLQVNVGQRKSRQVAQTL